MKGTFRLYYRAGAVDEPCVGVAYEVTSSGDAIVASGQTDTAGHTKAFEGIAESDTYQLRVRSADGAWKVPDTCDGPDAATRMPLGGTAVRGDKVQAVRLNPYYQVRFLTHPDRRPLPAAKYTAYALDPRGNEAVARDSGSRGNVTGTTDRNGQTPLIHCGDRLVFKFEVPGTQVKVATRRLDPLIQGQANVIYELPFKTACASAAATADHEAHLAGKTSLPILISPQDDELIMIPQGDFEDFEETSGQLDKILAAVHLAKLDLSRALEAQKKSEIEAAEKALGLAEDKVKSELNKNFAKLADLKEVVTLETYNKGKSSATGASQMGLRRRYLRSDKYMQLRDKRINKAEYKLNFKFSGEGGTKASAEVKPKTLDAAALKESFKKISTSVKSSGKWSGDPHIFAQIDLAANQYTDTLRKSDTYQVDAQAQWLRLVGCAGANSEVDWAKRKAQIQGNLQLKAVLCEGKIGGQWAAPSLKGWMMAMGGEDLGALRFIVEVSVYGFAGAKVIATGAVGITLEQGKQVVKAIQRDGKDALGKLIDPKTGLPKFDAAGSYEATPKDLNGLKADIDAFAGVEAGITPAGKIQWLPPQEKDFVSFAEVSGTAAFSAGAGVQASLAIYFADGKFRVRAAARLCWGVGCKGALEFSVDASKVEKFAEWVSYQLLHVGFKELVYFEKGAFSTFSQLLLLCMSEGSPSAARIKEISEQIDAEFERFIVSLDVAKERNALVNNINRNPPWLVHATPETRGMLLYQITRHSLASHARDLPSVGGSLLDPEIHYMGTHKKAVVTIMKTVLTASGWDNTMQHMSREGTKSARDAGKNEGDVLRFLNNGISLAHLPPLFSALNETGPVMKPVSDKTGTGNEYLDQYLKMRGKLLDKFPKGYRIASLDSPAFDLLASMDGLRHPTFGDVQTAGSGEAFAGDPGSSVA